MVTHDVVAMTLQEVVCGTGTLDGLPRMTVPSANCTSSGATADTARGNVSSVNPSFGRGLCRRCACTHDTNVEYLPPSFFANAFYVIPLSGYARTSASRSAAGVIRRPRSSLFASSNSVAMVAIATSYTTHPLSPTWSSTGRLR